MRIDFIKIVLVNAVVMVFAQIFAVFQTFTGNYDLPRPNVIQFGLGILLFAPLPVLLFLLFKTGTVPEVRGKLRILAITIAVVSVVQFVATHLDLTPRISHEYFLQYALSLVSGIMYRSFLVALCFQSQGKPSADENQARLIWNAARVTLVAVCATGVMGVIRTATSMVKYQKLYDSVSNSAQGWHPLSHQFHIASGVIFIGFSVMTVWILYKGLSVANAALLADK